MLVFNFLVFVLLCKFTLGDLGLSVNGTHVFQGDSRCACIDSYSGVSSELQSAQTVNGCAGEEFPYYPRWSNGLYDDAAITCRPNYGIGCIAHDSREEEMCKFQEEPYAKGVAVNVNPKCFKTWCYVDSSCKLQSAPSKYYKDLRYSFSTCGTTTQPTEDILKSVLRGATLKIAYIHNYQPMAYQDGQTGEWKGFLVDFSKQVAADGDFKLEVRNISDAAFAFSKYAYTACAYDSYLGNIDLCWADLWVTKARAVYTKYSDAYDAEDFRLVVSDFAETNSLWGFLRPFDWLLWVILLFVIIVFGFGLWYVGAAPLPEDAPTLSTTDRTNWTVSLNYYFQHILYAGLMILMVGNDNLEGGKCGSNIILFVFQGFALLVTAAYTANLLSLLVLKSVNMELETVEDVIATNSIVCTLSGMVDYLKDTYAMQESNLWYDDTISTFGELITAMRAGSCDAALVNLDIARSYIQKNCLADSIKVGGVSAGPSFWLHVAATQEYIEAIKYQMARTSKSWSFTRNKHSVMQEETMALPDHCKLNNDPLSFNPEPLDMNDFGGIFIVVAAGLLITLLMKWSLSARRYFCRKSGSVSTDIPALSGTPASEQKNPENQNSSTSCSFEAPAWSIAHHKPESGPADDDPDLESPWVLKSAKL